MIAIELGCLTSMLTITQLDRFGRFIGENHFLT